MKAVFLLLMIPSLSWSQTLADVLKQGEDVFNKSCANGYCHGAQGAGGGAPRIAARGFDQAYIDTAVTQGVPNTAMQSFARTLPRGELTAVIAYVERLNGIANPLVAQTPQEPSPPPALAGDAARGRDLFIDAVRSFGRCSTCHEVNSIGIPVAAPIAAIPNDVAALKALATPRVGTAAIGGESMPALVLSNKSSAVLFYDLTPVPPVLRTELPGAVQIREGSAWRHSPVIGSYDDSELSAILTYLRAVLKP